ncbi:MAG: hypothetical protein JWQ61_643 [Collimonas fungivorans]|uniref:hypothetical protein n=1 Tax=Collimonas fungivorans TaxID=158899 RepID=UPI0026F20787|nr:hypothetical protein [Collimonas fungivorans]MDB5765829.1 hypothetical protein [Collimonas fungivorans]
MYISPKNALRMIAAAALVSSAAAHAQAPAPTRIRGEIVAVDATTLTVHRRSGDTVKIAITPDQAVGAVKNIKLSDIQKGAFIGTATKAAPGGKLVAMEVLVFPEAARGTGEGHYAWDLLPGSMMTNANVDTVATGVNGRTLQLSYKGGSQEVLVPENTPVVTPVPAKRADLIAGKKVFVVANGTATNLTAARILVEKDGVAPPM